MTTVASPTAGPQSPRRRVQEAIEAAITRRITGIPVLVMWEAAGAVLDTLLQPSVYADMDHLIRQERLLPDTRRRPPP
jgi:hypothetical protein